MLLDTNALAHQVDVSPYQPKGLTAAHSGGQCQPHGYDAAASLAFFEVQRQLHSLLGGEAAALGSLGTLDVVDEVAGVAKDDFLLHRPLHHLAELLVRLVQRTCACAGFAHLRIGLVDGGYVKILHRHVSEMLFNAGDLDFVALQGERGQGAHVQPALMELAGVGAHLQRHMLVVEHVLQLRAVGLKLDACLRLVAVHGALLGPLALAAGFCGRQPMADAIDLATLHLDDGALAIYGYAFLAHGLSVLFVLL